MSVTSFLVASLEEFRIFDLLIVHFVDICGTNANAMVAQSELLIDFYSCCKILTLGSASTQFWVPPCATMAEQ